VRHVAVQYVDDSLPGWYKGSAIMSGLDRLQGSKTETKRAHGLALVEYQEASHTWRHAVGGVKT
jgi:hypothetical protein